jgi:hypothetical protein
MQFIHRNYYIYGAITLAILIVLITKIVLIIRKRRNKLNTEVRWKELQKLLSRKSNWKDVIIQADALLDEALKNKHFKGKTTGERLVSAQRQLTANDMIWFSHKLRNKLIDEQDITISKSDVKKCLLGYWRALKDLGVFTKNEQ